MIAGVKKAARSMRVDTYVDSVLELAQEKGN